MLLRKIKIVLTTILLIGQLFSSATAFGQNNMPEELVEYELFLIGDARRLGNFPELKDLLKTQLDKASAESAAVFLGDNAHPAGLLDSASKDWETAHQSLLDQFDLLRHYKGRFVFIPGNHDWGNQTKDGLSRILNQQQLIEQQFGDGSNFLPENGTPGPVLLQLSDQIALIIIDSHWWFFPHQKNGNISYELYLDSLQNVLVNNNDKHLVVAAHNPLYSDGIHGGRLPLAANLFPLTEKYSWMYIPLPGFIYTAYRKYVGAVGDRAHPKYKKLKTNLLSVFRDYPNLIYASGHDHNLQYGFIDSMHFIVSGSAGGAQYVAKKGVMDFAKAVPGFSKIEFMTNGAVYMSFIAPKAYTKAGANADSANILFRKLLYTKQVQNDNQKTSKTAVVIADSLVKVSPRNAAFVAGTFKEKMLGKNYRADWMKTVTVPVFDYKISDKTLEIVKLGGGAQTKSLRLSTDRDRQYVLRSVDKDPSGVIPEALKVEFAEDVLLDQMSASQPYAALAVPPLAKALGVYHTNPRIVYLSNDERLGKYRKFIPEGLYLFEERPANDRSECENFGFAKDIISSDKMLDSFLKKQKSQMDQPLLLRSRLLDMLISDWDRHEDQWRWAGFKQDSITLYQPIPRDRDMAFYVNEGLLPFLASLNFLLRKNQGLDEKVRDIRGLNLQARHLDRRFLNQLNRADWREQIRLVQTKIDDQVIAEAMAELRPFADSNSLESIETKLKARREILDKIGEKYYEILAKEVDVVGTKDDEKFLVHFDENTVKVEVRSNEAKRQGLVMYQRVFEYPETKYINLYGYEGKDLFLLSGDPDKVPKVRILPGTGKNRIVSDLTGQKRSKTVIYTSSGKDILEGKNQFRNIKVKDKKKFAYQYDAFNYNKYIPYPVVGSNADDGFFFGFGLHLQRQGFHKEPFKNKQNFDIRFLTLSNALDFKYNGFFIDVVQGTHLELDLGARDNRFTHNFYGFGNNTEALISSHAYYRVQLSRIYVAPSVVRYPYPKLKLSIGPYMERLGLDPVTGTIISDIRAAATADSLKLQNTYLGVNVGLAWENLDSERYPTRGMQFSIKNALFGNLTGEEGLVNQLSADLSFFVDLGLGLDAVLAMRSGASVTLGDYAFYHASTLGAKQNLRGYRDMRFTGDIAFYQNTELRLRLFGLKTYATSGSLGLIIFNDMGRVWLQDEKSYRWHDGYGVGIWGSPFNSMMFSFLFERSSEEKAGLFSIRTGFFF